MYNYQLPAMQENIKNNNYLHPFAKNQINPTKYAGQSFHFESLHSSPNNYLTNYCSNPSPHPKMP
jgi:hypothetical protein